MPARTSAGTPIPTTSPSPAAMPELTPSLSSPSPPTSPANPLDQGPSPPSAPSESPGPGAQLSAGDLTDRGLRVLNPPAPPGLLEAIFGGVTGAFFGT